jgi:hypothetical protein
MFRLNMVCSSFIDHWTPQGRPWFKILRICEGFTAANGAILGGMGSPFSG